MMVPYLVQSGMVDDGYAPGAKIEELTAEGVLTRWASDGTVIEQTTGHPVDVPVEEPAVDLAGQVAELQATIAALLGEDTP